MQEYGSKEGKKNMEVKSDYQSTLLCIGVSEDSEVRVPWSPCALGKKTDTHPSLKGKVRKLVRKSIRIRMR